MPIKVLRSESLQTGDRQSVSVAGQKILLIRSENGLYAIEDSCPHIELPLSDGSVSGKSITCRNHGVEVDIESGQVIYSMGFIDLQPVKTFSVWEENGDILIDIE